MCFEKTEVMKIEQIELSPTLSPDADPHDAAPAKATVFKTVAEFKKAIAGTVEQVHVRVIFGLSEPVEGVTGISLSFWLNTEFVAEPFFARRLKEFADKWWGNNRPKKPAFGTGEWPTIESTARAFNVPNFIQTPIK